MNLQLTQLGPYRIGKPIGKGGMGAVYEATDSQSGQRVAIKALSPHLAQVEGFRERFEAEIESLKTLRHEGIVRLYGYGEQDGILFYSMEIINGASLEDELRNGRRFDWREVTDIAIQLCMALKHAHDHGIIHRDIKPANILFADEKQVKLADFGIARLFGTTSSLTTAGGVLGTADYMSPEQADGRPVTARCDQYSLGGVMYALLAGRPPFRAKNLPEMLQLQRYAEPEPVSRYAPDTPKQLEQVIAQLLAKEPAARFPNTQVLARHLQAMVRALSRPAPDGFALENDPIERHLDDADRGNSIAFAVTRDELKPKAPAPSDQTPARPQVRSSAGTAANVDEDATLAVDEPTGTQNGQALKSQLAAQVGVAAPPSSAAVYTTVEEDLARQQSTRSWMAVVAPLLSLVLFVSAIGGFAYYVTRPYSADALYKLITDRPNADDVNSIRTVKSEVAEFVTRFPDDPRVEQLREFAQRIDLDDMNRRLQNRARKGAVEAQLLPVEMLYLDATYVAASSPEKAISMLQSLIALYSAVPEATSTSSPEAVDANERRAGCVALAKRQLKQLQDDVAELHARQLTAIQERLATAAKLVAAQPNEARDIYQAVIDLYANDAWAVDAVDQARKQLETLNAAHE